MKYLIFSLLLLGVIPNCEGQSNTQKKPLSPHETTMGMIGSAHIHIDYSSPGVRGRTIFGALIPYGKLWRAGANNATWIESNKDLIINNQTLPAGKYGLFIIPNKDIWTIIINKNWNQHGTDKYKPEEDVLRIMVTPSGLDELQEHLEYQVKKTGEQTGVISLAWERTKVELPIKIVQ